MPKKLLTVATLADLSNGFGAKVINRALKVAYEDVDDRGEDGIARTVDIKVTLKRVKGGPVKIDIQAVPKLPAWKPDPTFANVTAKGLEFNSECASNPDQRTITDEVDEAEAPAKK